MRAALTLREAVRAIRQAVDAAALYRAAAQDTASPRRA
jgi:hypothetical protein